MELDLKTLDLAAMSPEDRELVLAASRVWICDHFGAMLREDRESILAASRTWMCAHFGAMSPEGQGQILLASANWLEEQKRTGGRIPFDVYKVLVRTYHTCFVDVAIVARVGYKPWVMLERRPGKAHLYPGVLDIPGGNFAYREFIAAAAQRTAQGLGFSESPEYAGVASYVKTGPEVGISFLFVVRIDAIPDTIQEGCTFYPLEELPEDLVPWQGWAYPRLIRQYLETGIPGIEEYPGE